MASYLASPPAGKIPQTIIVLTEYAKTYIPVNISIMIGHCLAFSDSTGKNVSSAVQNLYNMLERDCGQEIFPYCLENGIGVVPFSPVASGFLSGKNPNYTNNVCLYNKISITLAINAPSPYRKSSYFERYSRFH